MKVAKNEKMKPTTLRIFVDQELSLGKTNIVLCNDYSLNSFPLVTVAPVPNIKEESNCSICPKAMFDNLADLKAHYKSDWHVANLKRAIEGKTPHTECTFDLTGSSQSDTSSSDSEGYEDACLNTTQRDCFLRFEVESKRGQQFRAYRSVILDRDEMQSRQEINSDVFQKRLVSEAQSKWCIVLIRSGRVAAGIFDNSSDSMICHKTFKRYTDRQSRGGSQLSKDKEKSGIKSAGSFLRRKNAALLEIDVRELLDLWKSSIASCSLFFWNPTATGKGCLFGDAKHAVLLPTDPRIRTIPFTTSRPTKDELWRSYVALNCIYS